METEVEKNREHLYFCWFRKLVKNGNYKNEQYDFQKQISVPMASRASWKIILGPRDLYVKPYVSESQFNDHCCCRLGSLKSPRLGSRRFAWQPVSLKFFENRLNGKSFFCKPQLHEYASSLLLYRTCFLVKPTKRAGGRGRSP